MSKDHLPFKPESLKSLCERYSCAIAELIDVEFVLSGAVSDPGASREHVFDTEDGIRLIISREDQGDEGNAIHWSASLDESFPSEFLSGGTDFIMKLLEQRFHIISGDYRPFNIRTMTSDGIIHWFILENPKAPVDLGEIVFKV